MTAAPHRKKLIEVSLPLPAIDAASAREKSIRHGHPSTLHLWWARRPLAACRAVLFAQIVDDPSAWPDMFPTESAQARERERLHKVIEDIVPWEASRDGPALRRARAEIARSLARGRGEAGPDPGDPEAVLGWLAEHAPPVCDPFCGGGSIPLEAQRLGLRARGSDLNPVAVLVSKATCEIPPRFAGRPPVNPGRDPLAEWTGARGLAEDVRYYGRWMRDKAERRIGHLYPKARLEDGTEATVIAWLWARTVASPDPSARGAHVPLLSSFMLSTKKNRLAWAEVVRDSTGRDGWRFIVNTGNLTDREIAERKQGTRIPKSQDFRCSVTGTPIPRHYIRDEGKAGRLRKRLIAITVQKKRSRHYIDSNEMHEEIDVSGYSKDMENVRSGFLSGATPTRAMITGGVCSAYGLSTWGHLFTDRQLVALITFSDLVAEAREKALADALAAGLESGAPRLVEGGNGAEAYADAVATYLGLCVSRLANRSSSLNFWDSRGGNIQQVFARQALPMVWDFCEGNPFSDSTGNFVGQVDYLANVVMETPATRAEGAVIQQDAAEKTPLADQAMIATDPPYYDNIGYADLSDFFYVWQRRSLHEVWPRTFRRVATPKAQELVATSHRHKNRLAAQKFFMDGIGKALRNIHRSSSDEYPITLYYAFKQSEIAKEGLISPGWATFLQGIVDAGYTIDGTWPMRTELAGNLKKRSNALASSIVIVCRKRPADAPAISRREFMARLRATLPGALETIRRGGVGPVDMAQAALGPGMEVFTAASRVLEPDDTPMTVRAAIALINRARDEISGEEAAGYDAATRFCIDWFDHFGVVEAPVGDAIVMAQAQGVGVEELEAAGVFFARGGRARLPRRHELPPGWRPEADATLTVWECAWHLARALEAEDGGVDAAARLLAAMPPERAEDARLLAYRLYDISERKGRAAEAQSWDALVREWPSIEEAAGRMETAPRQVELL